jgi:hypothetical protein
MSTAPNEIKNGIKNTSLSFFFKRKNATDWTREDGERVLDAVLKISGAQLHKSIYYGLELIHRITRINTRGTAKFRDVIMERLSANSISFASQHLEMMADFNMYGQTNGVLGHYYNRCFDETISNEKQTEFINDFVNFALVHSYVTGVNTWFAAIVNDIEDLEVSDGVTMSDRLVKLYALVDELAISRSTIRAEIAEMRKSRTEEHVSITEQFVPVQATIDDSDRLYELETVHNRSDTLVEQIAPTK